MQQNRAGAPGWSFRPLAAITFGNMIFMGFVNSMRGVSFPLIKTGFGASYAQIGLMNAVASVASVCFSVAAGIYMNRFGPKKTTVAAFALTALGLGSLYFASAFWLAALFYLVLQSGIGFFSIGLNGTGVKIFTKKSGLMLNLLHFFYGIGAIAGPWFMGVTVNRGLKWQGVYPLALIPAAAFLSVTLFIRFPGKNEAGEAKKKPSFWLALKDPTVWLFGFILGISSAIEACSVSWSGLYLFDIYGLDPSAAGAAFVSAFYALYTVSRFLSGFVIEKTGYMRSLLVSGAAIFVILIAAFSLGRRGVYLLPAVGFFVAIMWPTILAISVTVCGERAEAASSGMIPISFILTGLIQYGFGLSNRFLGAAWAYRSCVPYSLILAILLFMLARKVKQTGVKIR